jgi:tRNA(Ile)-lysidine synthase
MPASKLSNTLHPLEVRVLRTIQTHAMLATGDHVLVAVSGGADSVALLRCLHRLASRLNISLTVAHLNHGIRGPEADADEDFVRRLSADLRLQFFSEAIDTKRKAKEAGRNLEELARQVRYDFLNRVADTIGAHRIAVGHTLNDQAETILFRLIRGSGIEGLSAIRPVIEGRVIRPLLECSRDSILGYLKQNGVNYREDSSNRDVQYARNRIRHELLPYLAKHFNPRIISTLSREALLAGEAWSFIEAEAERAFDNLECSRQEGLAIRLSGLLELNPVIQKEVLRRAIRKCLGSLRGITSRHIDSVLSLCGAGSSGDQVRLPHGSSVIRQYEDLLLMRQAPRQTLSFAHVLPVPGTCRVAEAGALFRASIIDTPDPETMKQHRSRRAYLELSLLPAELTVRSRRPGDRYGGPGHRKVKKMLIDGKMPSMQRPGLPMVAAADSVIWIPGFRPARSWEARADSQSCVLLEIMMPDQNSAA